MTKNLDSQQIHVIVNEKNKFAYVGVNNMYNADGTINYGPGLDNMYRNAERSKILAGSTNPKSYDKTFGSSIMVQMMNTPKEDWEVFDRIIDLDLLDAQMEALRIAEEYEAKGYNVTGSRGHAKAVRQTGLCKQIDNTKIKNATMDRIYSIVDKLTEGLEDLDLVKIKRDIYVLYNDPYANFDTRRKWWYHIYKNLDKYTCDG